MTASGLTWLWQGIALTLAMSTALRLLPRLNAATRYWMWWCTLGAVGSLGWVSDTTGLKSCATGGTGLQPCLPGAAESVFVFHVPAASDTLITIVLGAWVGIALVSLLRILPGIHAVFRLRDRCRDFPRDVEAQLPLWLEARGLAARRTRLMLCDAVRGATVLGFHRPYIALPPSLLKALTRDELDQIVLHEHAHVQRWDDWARLCQALLQSALWIHPAMAVIGRRLSLEREMACDEWVVARTGLPKAYARCLTRAAEVRGRMGMEPLLGPALFARRRDLVLRVNRLLAGRGRPRRSASAAAVLAGGCVLVAVAIQLRGVPLVGEVVEMPLPLVVPPDTVRLKPDTTFFTPDVRVVRNEPTNLPNPRTSEPNEPTNLSNPRTYEPNEPLFEPPNRPTPEPNEPVSLSGRSFDGHYAAAERPTAAPESRAAWQLAAAAGVEIGASARKTSVGIANTFTRAGVSLARRF